jgi:Subtilase family
MSWTTPSGPFVLVALLVALAVPTGATASGDALPHALPPATAPTATTTARWLVAANPSAATTRLARAHGARALTLRGTFSVPTSHARALAHALARRNLLRYTEADTALAPAAGAPARRASAFEASPTGQTWARGTIVTPDLAPPAAFAPIGVLDDVVDAAVADVAQARVLKASPTKRLDVAAGVEPCGPSLDAIRAGACTAHGTEVASVAAGRADGQGVIGIAPGAPLLSFGYKTLTCAEVADGVLDLADAGAKVINLSFEIDEDCRTLRLAIAAAFGSGALIVGSAGNDRGLGDPKLYPAAYPHVLTVGSVGFDTATPSDFSSTGDGLDLAAPGEGIPMALPPALDLRDGTPDGLTTEDGTSFAAPIVSGVASWLIAARPKLTAGQYAGLLRAGARDVGRPGWDRRTGFGAVSLAAALAAPVPAADRGEPNDAIDHVDGSAFSTADPFIYRGGAARTIKASVTPAEDPADVYRIRLRAGARAKATLTPTGANADLSAYAGKAKFLTATPLARSRKAGTATDRITIRNTTRKTATFYVVVRTPASGAHTLATPYALKLAKG